MNSLAQFKYLAAAIAASSLGISSLEAADAPANAGNALGNVERASKLLGMDLRGEERKVGEMDNLVVDLESGRVLYAVIDSGDNRVALPPGIFRRVAPGAIYVDATREKIRSAPRFTERLAESSVRNEASFLSEVYRHFGLNEWWRGGDRPADQGTFNNVHLVTELRGADVVNVMNQEMGEVQNLGIDLPAGRVVYVLMSPDDSLDLGDALYPMPPNVLTKSTTDRGKFSADINKEKLASAPNLMRDQWSRLSDQFWASRVYQHYGKQAYFGSIPALEPTGRDSGTTTPPSDRVIGRNPGDREIRASDNPWYRDWEEEWERRSNRRP